MQTTLACALSQWTPGLGDNHPAGWLTVLIYLVAALAAALVARELTGQERRERAFWWIAAAILLFLAVNKQLDLQSLVTMIGRCHARLHGWYGIRRAVQQVFILAVSLGGAVLIGVLALLLRGIQGRVWPALLGLGFVCGFVVMRAASFHHMDGLLGSHALGLRMNVLLELAGPILVMLVAMPRRRALGLQR